MTKYDSMDRILSFLKEIEKAKHIERQIYLSGENRLENDAEHSWHMAMFIILFEKYLPKGLDFLKIIKMALIHDLVEIYAGDTFAYDKEAKKDKKEKEERAAEKLFSMLPEDPGNELRDLFDEFEERKTGEAKTVKSFDRLQAIMQNLCSEGNSWKKHGIELEDIEEYNKEGLADDDIFQEIYTKLIDEAREKGFFKKKNHDN